MIFTALPVIIAVAPLCQDPVLSKAKVNTHTGRLVPRFAENVKVSSPRLLIPEPLGVKIITPHKSVLPVSSVHVPVLPIPPTPVVGIQVVLPVWLYFIGVVLEVMFKAAVEYV